MNFDKPVLFDKSKSVRFDSLKIGELFITCDSSVYDTESNKIMYSERVYCKVPEFFNNCLDSYNAIGVTEEYVAYMGTCDKVIRVNPVNWCMGE